MKTWHDNLKETVTGEAEDEGESPTDTGRPNHDDDEIQGAANTTASDVASDGAGAVEMPERRSNNPLIHEAEGKSGAPTDAQVGDARGDGGALARLSAQMQDQQRQLSLLLNQQAQVMEAVAKLTDANKPPSMAAS